MKIRKVLCSVMVSLSIVLFLSAAALAEENRTGVVDADLLNLRDGDSTSANLITRLEGGTSLSILEESDGWYRVTTGVYTGWVSSKYVSVKDSQSNAGTAGVITGDKVNVRDGAGLWAEVISRLDDGTRITVIGRSDDWYNIQLSNGCTGWVNKQYVAIGLSRSDDTRRQMVAFAKKYLGVPYVWGGNSPSGFDCSGFVKYVYSNFGITLNRVAADQASQGTKVLKSELVAGDLVFFDTDGGGNYINHVGMYIGNGTFIHASSGSAHGVTISDLNGFYAGSYMTARRFVR